MLTPMKSETYKRLELEWAEKRKAARADLYIRLIEAAYKNRHNPTGKDYLERAKSMRRDGITHE